LAKGANQGQMAQIRTKHRNLQQAILSESAQRAQPDSHNPDFGGHVIDHPLPIEVFVAVP
jgi:hypothetical protein